MISYSLSLYLLWSALAKFRLLWFAEVVLPWLPPAGPVLEVGPGPGVLLEKLAARHPPAAGLDLSPGMLNQAQRRLRRAQRYVRLVRADATRMPFVAESFAGVVATFALNAVPDGQAAVCEMARVLRPAGVLALVDAGYPESGNPFGSFLAWLWELGGDFMRDEAEMMRLAGLQVVVQRDFGAFDGMRLVVGRKPLEG